MRGHLAILFLLLLARVGQVHSLPLGGSDWSEGVNFTNILQAAFSYKSILRSFYVLTVWVCIFLVKENQRKSCS